MKTPRDISGKDLVNLLIKFQYKITRQTGSHVRLTHKAEIEYHITIPLHNPIKIGTLDSILKDIANQLNISRNKLIEML